MSGDVDAARDALRAVIVGQQYEDRIDALEAAIRAEAGTLEPCGSYESHDWSQTGSPSYCGRCHITFPAWDAGRARLAGADR